MRAGILVKRKRTGARAALLAAFALSGVLLLGQVVKNQGYVPFSDAPINYRSENLDDPIARLQKQLDRGEVRLPEPVGPTMLTTSPMRKSIRLTGSKTPFLPRPPRIVIVSTLSFFMLSDLLVSV